jgi:acyl-homoserine lactone acylase PvdQ
MPRHQRGEMMTELLEKASKVTVEQAIDIAFSPDVYRAEAWQARLKAASDKISSGTNGAAKPSAEAMEVYDLIQRWNRRSDADSEGALAFYAFKRSLAPDMARQWDVPSEITDEQLMTAITKAAEWLKSNYGSVRVPYGRLFRVGREGSNRTWPVGGGSLNGGQNNVGMATPRAISFRPVGKEMVGVGGQTSTQIVILTNPPQSYAIIPLGMSDQKESPHWDDQAEKLFSKSKAASSYFMDKAELMKHVTATKTLKRAAAAQAAR